ncbi:hypothetical protein D3C80_1423410 [compost metagenome]
MRGKQDRCTCRAQAGHQFIKISSQCRIKAAGGLVEQQDARCAEQRLRQSQSLPHALGIGPDGAIGCSRREPHALEQALHVRHIHTFQPCIEVKRLAPRQRHVEGDALRQVTEPLAHSEIAPGRVFAQHLNCALRRPDEAEHQLDQRRLARAVMTDKRDRLPLLKFEGYILDRLDPAVAFRHA